MKTVSSRDRMLAVLQYQEPDRVPLLFNSFGFQPPPPLQWSNAVEEAKTWLSLGTDAWLHIGPPLMFHPDVKARQWEEMPEDKPWPLMIKEYDTPAGIFRQEVYRTPDWVSADWPTHKQGKSAVELLDDYNVPRYRNRPIETEEDVDKLRYLLHPLSGDAVLAFRERAAAVARQAEQLGVLLVGHGSSGVDAAVWLCGVENLLMMAIDRPEVFRALLDVIHNWDTRNVEILLDTPVDLVMRRGYYEGTSFWSPALYREHFLPRIKELTRMVHQAGLFAGYTMSVGFMPLLDMFVEIGYDAHCYLDPISDGRPVDLGEVKSVWNKKIAVIGGLNTPITLEQGTPEAIRREVFDAVRVLGEGGGLALTPAEAIYAGTPWQSIETLIEAWKEVCRYRVRAAPDGGSAQ